MGAKLVVLAGVGRGTEYWVENDFVRMGSGQDCDMSVPDPNLPAHVSTLEWRDNRYYIYNRSDDTITLAGKALMKGQSAVWLANTDLRLSGDLALRLLTEGNPAPSPKPLAQAIAAGDVTALAADDLAKAKAGARNTQLVVLLACALLALVVLMLSQEKPQTAGAVATFDELMAKLSKERDKDPSRGGVMEALQRARVMENREDWAGARIQYLIIRDRVLPVKLKYADKFPVAYKLDSELWAYVRKRLSTAE